MIIQSIDYNQGVNQSYSVEFEMQQDNFSYTPNCCLYSHEDYMKSSFSCSNLTEESITYFKESIVRKIQELKEDMASKYIEIDESNRNSLIDDFILLLDNIEASMDNTIIFFNQFDNRFLSIFKPEIEIDFEGEISFEWYGRKGARANLTFGKKGELYFIFLFHGESSKCKLFNNSSSIKQVTSYLVKLSLDKYNE